MSLNSFSFGLNQKTNDYQTITVLIQTRFFHNYSSESCNFSITLAFYGWFRCTCFQIRTCYKLAVSNPFFACSLSPKDGFSCSNQFRSRICIDFHCWCISTCSLPFKVPVTVCFPVSKPVWILLLPTFSSLVLYPNGPIQFYAL